LIVVASESGELAPKIQLVPVPEVVQILSPEVESEARLERQQVRGGVPSPMGAKLVSAQR